MHSDALTPEQLAESIFTRDLSACGNLFHRWQWSLSSSSNYSALLGQDSIIISQSGVDKERMGPGDFMIVDFAGRPRKGYESLRSSAETELHCHVYRHARDRDLGIGSVLHTHSKFAVFSSRKYRSQGALVFSGFEMQKIFEGVTTHESTVAIPVFENSQHMPDIVSQFDAWLARNPWPVGYLIEGHGIYSWGKTVLHARQKLEALEHLMEIKYMEDFTCKAD